MKVAVIGCGGIAKAHLQCTQLCGDELVAAVDTNLENANAAVEQYGGIAMSNVDEMLAKVAPDAAVIATPPNVHKEIGSKLMQAGIPILCEKPLAHTVEDAEALVELADKTGIPAYVAYCHRFTPASQVMRDYAREGKFGRKLYFRNGFTGYVDAFDGSWRLDFSIAGGGSLIDTASHSIDLFQFIIGPVAEAKASFYFPEPGRGDQAGSLMLIAEDGTAGHIMFGWKNSKSECAYEVVGTDLSMSYDLATSGASVQVYKPNAEVENLPVEAGCDVRFVEQYKAFQRAVKGEPTILATFEDGLAVARVCDMCYSQALGASL